MEGAGSPEKLVHQLGLTKNILLRDKEVKPFSFLFSFPLILLFVCRCSPMHDSSIDKEYLYLTGEESRQNEASHIWSFSFTYKLCLLEGTKWWRYIA